MVTDGAYVRSRLANAGLSEPELESCSLLMMRTFALATMDWIEDSHGLSIDEYVHMTCNYLWYGLSGVGQSNNTLLPEPITVQGRLLGACPYSFLDEEVYVWAALWATRPAARARPFCPASSEGPGGVAGAGGMSA